MVEDLLDGYDLLGMGQQEVVALLGEPDFVFTVGDLRERTEVTSDAAARPETWIEAGYELGQMSWRSGAFPPYRLWLRFRDGRVTRTYLDD